jgi:hypothetical protein
VQQNNLKQKSAFILKWNASKTLITKNEIKYLGVRREDPVMYRAKYEDEIKPMDNFKIFKI